MFSPAELRRLAATGFFGPRNGHRCPDFRWSPREAKRVRALLAEIDRRVVAKEPQRKKEVA